MQLAASIDAITTGKNRYSSINVTLQHNFRKSG
jgi:hypothetical protein